MSATPQTAHPRPAAGQRLETIVSLVRDWAAAAPGGIVMREKRLGLWQEVTWADYDEAIQTVAHGLMSLGVEPGDRVAIHSENRSEWLYADLGIVACRAITVGLYPTNPAAEVGYLLQDSGTRVLIAEDQEQVDKALDVESQLPDLEWIVYIEPRGVRKYDHPKLLSWEDFLARGAAHRTANPDRLDDLAGQVEADDVVTLVYTSGTTGPPKGAMLTVRNVEYAMDKLVTSGGFYDPPPGPDDVIVSYLPLCHVAERIATTWVSCAAGTQVHFAESIETVQANLREIQPTLFFAVPRIWEKIHAGIQIRMFSASRLKRLNYKVWMSVAERIGDELVERDGNHTWWTQALYWLGYPFLFRALRERIGLGKCRTAASGAAPIAPEVLKFFFGLNIIIREVYGMTENSAVATVNFAGRVKLGTVGEPHPGIELKLAEDTNEILVRHPGVFAGYWGKPEKTAETIDEDGWLHTGDVGEWVDGTHIRIVDRIKDIIITAGGKNISPSEIENSLKTSPFIKEAVVIGDQRKFLTALIGIELDTVGDWATRKRIPYTTYRDLAMRQQVLEKVQEAVRETNEKFARVEHIRKFRMIPKELDHEDGELTATQKVKRSSLVEMFSDLVDDMYSGGTAHAGGDMAEVHTPIPVVAEEVVS
ncbi:AMP-dependent synthetase/ligase [soil metagenome]